MNTFMKEDNNNATGFCILKKSNGEQARCLNSGFTIQQVPLEKHGDQHFTGCYMLQYKYAETAVSWTLQGTSLM